MLDELSGHGAIDIPEKGSPEYNRVCRKVAKRMQHKWEADYKHHKERLSVVYDSVNEKMEVKQFEPDGAKISLSQLISDFVKRKVGSKNWSEGSVRNHRPKMNAMLQVFGPNRLVNEITVQDARKYAKLLELLPPSFSLKGYDDLTGLTPKELEGKHKQTLDVSTRREYLNFAKSLFKFAIENEYVEKNPIISGIIPPKKENVRDQRLPFDAGDLRLIFNAKTFLNWSRSSPSRFFIPLLALFTV